MTYVIHGSFSIKNINVTEYEAKLYDICNSYSGENIYVNYENMNSHDWQCNNRNNNKLTPVFKGTIEVKFQTMPLLNNNIQVESQVQVNNQVNCIPINELCKFLRQMQRNKVIIDMIYDETNNYSLFQSLQLRKMSYGDYETFKSQNKKVNSKSKRERSYTESEVLLLNSLKQKSENVPTYEEYLNALAVSMGPNYPCTPPVPPCTPNISRSTTPTEMS